MATFTLICDAKVRAIPIRECGDPLVNIVDCPALRLSRKRSTTNPFHMLVRSGVVEHLLAAQNHLPAGFYLCLEEGFRSVELQRQLFHDYLALLREAMGNISEDVLMEEASKYVAMPDGIIPHNTGGAVDVTLVSVDGIEYDFGSSSNETPLENGKRNFIYGGPKQTAEVGQASLPKSS